MHPYYQILGLPDNASIQDVKKAYRAIAKKHHPDAGNSSGNAEIFIKATEAYDMLTKLQDKIFVSKLKEEKKTERENNYEWIREQMMKSRKRAAHYARMRYEEFEKTLLFKSAQITYKAIHAIYFVLGILMMVVPIALTDYRHTDLYELVVKITGIAMAEIVGAVMVFYFGISLYEFMIEKK